MKNSLSVFLLAIFISGCAVKHKIPITKREHTLLVSKQDELLISKDEYNKILKNTQLSTNKKNLAQIKRVSKRLLKNIKNKQGYKFEVILIKNTSINACALPDGKIVVNSGIFKVAVNDAQIATILAHEIAHLLSRHVALRVTRNKVLNASELLSSSAIFALNPFLLVPFIISYESIIKHVIEIPKYKYEENEADIIALHILKASNYNLKESLVFWDNMHKHKINRVSSTHDTYLQRKQNIKNEIRNMKKHQKKLI